MIILHFDLFLSPWIRIRIPNPDLEDTWIRLQSGSGSETLCWRLILLTVQAEEDAPVCVRGPGLVHSGRSQVLNCGENMINLV